jgi:hypothetical protein
MSEELHEPTIRACIAALPKETGGYCERDYGWDSALFDSSAALEALLPKSKTKTAFSLVEEWLELDASRPVEKNAKMAALLCLRWLIESGKVEVKG